MSIHLDLKSYLSKPEDDFRTLNYYNSDSARIFGILNTWAVMDSKSKKNFIVRFIAGKTN